MADWWEASREDERAAVAKAWPEFQGVPVTKEFTPEVHRAMLAAALNSSSNLCVLPWQDILGTRERINLPGTMSDSNWAYRITQDVDALLEDPQSRGAAERLAWLTASARR
jgi:4-alpha-glucanotransferase